MRTALWALLKTLSGMENVWWANGNQTFTGRPLLTMQITTETGGEPEVSKLGANGLVSVRRNKLFTLSLQYYDSTSPFSAFSGLLALVDKFFLAGSQQALQCMGLAFVGVLNGPQDSPAVTGAKWESRAVCDLQFRQSVVQTETVGLIEKVEGVGTVQGTQNIFEAEV